MIMVSFKVESQAQLAALVDFYERTKTPGEHISNPLPAPHPMLMHEATVTAPAPHPMLQHEAAADVDGYGTVYDPAIHAATRTKTIDGRWKRKRGLGADTLDALAQQAVTPAPAAFPGFEPAAPARDVSYADIIATANKLTSSGRVKYEEIINICTRLKIDPQTLGADAAARVVIMNEMEKLG
ncbi:MAG: hypothetical protein WC322_01385 [Candidatus Paceibacterota bacterium]|jgi:hypothetical protein